MEKIKNEKNTLAFSDSMRSVFRSNSSSRSHPAGAMRRAFVFATLLLWDDEEILYMRPGDEFVQHLCFVIVLFLLFQYRFLHVSSWKFRCDFISCYFFSLVVFYLFGVFFLLSVIFLHTFLLILLLAVARFKIKRFVFWEIDEGSGNPILYSPSPNKHLN